MTSPKKSREEGGGRNPTNVPSQEDEEDIINEVGAEQDEETGRLMADEESVREIGALDAESVRKNRHVRRVVDKKRKGEKVSFGIEDPIAHYDAILHVWENDKVEIRAQNLDTQEQHTIKSQPRSGVELYDVLKTIHGQRDKAKYKIEFVGALRKEFIGNSRIVMPDARAPSQQGQPPQQQYYQPQQPPQAAPPPQAPTFVMPSAGTDPMQTVQQILDVADQLRARMTPPPAPHPEPQAPIPPPPTSSDPTAILNWALQAVQKLQQQTPQVAQPPQQAAPMGMPPFQPPPGTTWVYVPNAGWVAQALGGTVGVGGGGPGGSGGTGPMHRSQRPPYYPQGQGDPNYPQRGYPGQAPPQRDRTPAQAFRDSVSSVRDLYNTAQELQDLFGAGRETPEHEVSEDDDSPIKIIDTGHGKLAVNKADGALRWAETGLMVLPDVLKWLGEQHEKIQTAKQRPQTQQRRQALPPGFVRVDENYVPPRGFVAVPIEQDELPEPPSNVPPAIDDEHEEQEAPHPAWGAPVIPQNG